MADGKWFPIYSRATVCFLLLAFVLTNLGRPHIAAGMPAPWVGVYERINVFGYMPWVMVFAIVLPGIQKGIKPL